MTNDKLFKSLSRMRVRVTISLPAAHIFVQRIYGLKFRYPLHVATRLMRNE